MQLSSADTKTACFTGPYQWKFCSSSVGGADLGVWIDRGLSMSTRHVTKVVSGCFAVLRQLYSICHSVSRESLTRLVVSLVLTGLDHCNAVLAGLPHTSSIAIAINAAACMI